MSSSKPVAKPKAPVKVAESGKARKKGVPRNPIKLVPIAAVAADSRAPGPMPVPDVRQEGCYVYGIIQSRTPVSSGKMGIGGTGELVYAVTYGMSAAFLIERERESDFDFAVNRIGKKFGDGLNFKYTGPWPPYNFVEIRLKLQRGAAG